MAATTLTEQLSNFSNQVTLPGKLVPEQGMLAMGLNIDLVTYQTVNIDFTYAYENTNMKAVFGVFIDNSQNPQPVTIIAQQPPQQRLIVPAFAQGTFPILAPVRAKFQVTSNGSAVVPMIFTNIPLPEAVWNTQPASTTTTPSAFTIAAGPTAVNPWGTQHVTGGGFIQNPVGAARSIYVDFVNTAQAATPGTNGTTVELTAGASVPIPLGYISVSVMGTAGDTFVAVGLGVVA